MTITYNLLSYFLSWVETRKEKLNKRKEKKKEKKIKSKFYCDKLLNIKDSKGF